MPILMQEEEVPVAAHVDEDIDETKLATILAARGLRKNPITGEIEQIPSVKKPPRVCSCGSFVCQGLPIYGVPLPTFKDQVEPLWPQPSRDARAIQIRKAGDP